MASCDPSPKDESPEKPQADAHDDVAILVLYNAHDAGRRSMRGCGISALLWFACVGFFFIFAKKGEVLGQVLGVIGWIAGIYIIFIGPALGVLYGSEVVSYLNWRKKKGMANVAWRIFIGFWMLVFAALFLGFGGASIFVGFREFIKFEGGKESIQTLGVILLGVVLAGAGVFLTWQAFRKKEVSTEEQDIAAREAEKRAWENLDFAPLEAQLGCTLPAAYKAMMQPGSEWHEREWAVHPNGLDNDEELYLIFGLHLPDQEAIRKHPANGETMLCFASAEGVEYWIRPGTEDPPVYECTTDSLPFEVTEIAPRLSIFLSWPKD